MAEDAELDTSDSVEESDGCIRCDGRLIFVGSKDFHEGTRAWGFILGDLGELLTGGEELAMFVCEDCGHVEFFMPRKMGPRRTPQQKAWPALGVAS